MLRRAVAVVGGSQRRQCCSSSQTQTNDRWSQLYVAGIFGSMAVGAVIGTSAGLSKSKHEKRRFKRISEGAFTGIGGMAVGGFFGLTWPIIVPFYVLSTVFDAVSR